MRGHQGRCLSVEYRGWKKRRNRDERTRSNIRKGSYGYGFGNSCHVKYVVDDERELELACNIKYGNRRSGHINTVFVLTALATKLHLGRKTRGILRPTSGSKHLWIHHVDLDPRV